MESFQISLETIRAIETQIDIFKNRINTYQLSIEKIMKMGNNEVIKKSIEGYTKQVEFLKEKIELLEKDLEILKKFI